MIATTLTKKQAKREKEMQLKCRKNTCFIRITKRARENLRKMAINKCKTIQELVDDLSTVLLK